MNLSYKEVIDRARGARKATENEFIKGTPKRRGMQRNNQTRGFASAEDQNRGRKGSESPSRDK